MNIATIIPAYNPDPRFFAEVTESLLAQTVPPSEVVIVDDGSDEPVQAPFRVVRQVNRGVSGARNRGVLETSAELVHVLDQDEILAPTFYERLTPHFVEPQRAVVYCQMPLIYEDGSRTGWSFPGPQFSEPEDWLKSLIAENRVGSSAAIFRRSAWEQVGGFKGYRYVQDYRFWLDVALLKLAFKLVPEELAFHRRHSGQETASSARSQEEVVEMLQHLKLPIAYEAARRRSIAKVRVALADECPDFPCRLKLCLPGFPFAPRSSWAALTRISHKV